LSLFGLLALLPGKVIQALLDFVKLALKRLGYSF
jgi:hypothetical protein